MAAAMNCFKSVSLLQQRELAHNIDWLKAERSGFYPVLIETYGLSYTSTLLINFSER